MSQPLRFEFVQSASDPEALPPTRSEVAFLGRSNVGKSSLLNALANHRRLAHVSKTPGRTQLLNLFALGDGTTAVDLPGYGYAAVPGKTRAEWGPMIEGYLLGRERLVRLLVLVDGEIGPTKLDVQLLDWLRHHERPVTIVASKHDKVKPSKRGARRRELADGCGVAVDEVAWVSASKGTGIEELRGQIHGWLAEGLERWRSDEVPPLVPSGRGGDGGSGADGGAGRSGRGGRSGSRGRGRAAPVVEQNPDGTWPDEDEWN